VGRKGSSFRQKSRKSAGSVGYTNKQTPDQEKNPLWGQWLATSDRGVKGTGAGWSWTGVKTVPRSKSEKRGGKTGEEDNGSWGGEVCKVMQTEGGINVGSGKKKVLSWAKKISCSKEGGKEVPARAKGRKGWQGRAGREKGCPKLGGGL